MPRCAQPDPGTRLRGRLVQRAGPTGRPPAKRSHHTTGCHRCGKVDARSGIGTGISAADRATTLRALADASTRADDFTRPGHVVPLRTNDGVLGRPEAAVDLIRAAGLRPAAATCTIVSVHDPTTMAAVDELRDFAAEHALASVSRNDIVTWHRESESNAFAPSIVE